MFLATRSNFGTEPSQVIYAWVFTPYIVKSAVYHRMNMIEAASFEFTLCIWHEDLKSDNVQVRSLTLKNLL